MTVVALLLLVAGLYYSQYYNCGFSTTDEGAVVLMTERLLQGELPFVDLELGYGLLWFYPLVLLFEATGVDFIALRLYFMALATITSLLTFLALKRQIRNRFIAAVMALVVLFIPGTLHKTYIPLIVVANILFLPLLARKGRALGDRTVFTAGLVAAVSYHIRPDLGLGIILILVGTVVLQTLLGASAARSRVWRIVRALVLLGAAAAVPTVPLVFHAHARGFLGPFLLFLYSPVRFTLDSVWVLIGGPAALLGSAVSGVSVLAGSQEIAASSASSEAGTALPRVPITAIWRGGRHQGLAFLTYAPLVLLPAMTLTAFGLLIREARSSALPGGRSLGLLASCGLVSSAFPQFYVFRPDWSHLSQFMPGYVLLSTLAVSALWVSPARGAEADPSNGSWRWNFGTLAGRVLATLVALNVAGYLWVALQRPATGSLAMARGRTEAFVGANGVEILGSQVEKKLFTTVLRLVEENTRPDEFLVCYPYCSGFNVMTARRTFARRLYVDDSMLRLEPGWQRATIERIEAHQVPLIIIQDWAINGTEISRFKNWATDVMAYVAVNYELVERVGMTAFYRRKAVVREGDGSRRNQPSSINRAQMRRPWSACRVS